MFDSETSRLIREAPRISGVDPALLPQELTRAYADLVGLRMREHDLAAEPAFQEVLGRLRNIAAIYEAAVDSGATGTPRRAAAFVAGTAQQILARAAPGTDAERPPLITGGFVHPSVAAPLLFLIAEQTSDAREAARAIGGIRSASLIRTALLETIVDLASERFENVLERATRLARTSPPRDGAASTQATDALYGLCWAALVQAVAQLLGRQPPDLAFKYFERPREAFDEVVSLSTDRVDPSGQGARLFSEYAGPRHLARLLGHVADGLEGAGLSQLPAPAGAESAFWGRWTQHRSKSKPLLWRSHHEAIATGFLDAGRSAVLVLPTGSGKTTLSELKIAATVAAGRKVFFLVPTLALVDQLRDDLTSAFPASLGELEVAADGDLAALLPAPDLKTIEVMTPERCLAMLTFAGVDLSDLGLVVFDECHLLSPKGGGHRSLDAMLCLLHLLHRATDADFLLLSAMVTNGEEIAAWLADVTKRPCVPFAHAWKPSRQARGVVMYERSELDAITQRAREAREAKAKADKARGKAGRGKRVPADARMAVPYAVFGLHQNWSENAPADTSLVKLSDARVELALSGDHVTPNANAVAAALAGHASSAGLRVIVFVQQADHAPSTATKVAALIHRTAELTKVEAALWSAVCAETGGEEHSLVRPNDGALPHNGDMIPLERRLVESLFRRDDGARVIVATPTLAQGMNLPAELALLAGTKRHGDDGRTLLEQHEILNAAGRAGRAGQVANGTVLLIPEPVVAFVPGRRLNGAAVANLRSVLPPKDQCLRIDDPLTSLLDKIQTGAKPDREILYLVSRLQEGESLGDDEAAIAAVNRSLSAFRARTSGDERQFNAKLEALRAVLLDAAPTADKRVLRVAAFSGIAVEPLAAIAFRLQLELKILPSTIVGWMTWVVEFLQSDQPSFEALMETDLDTVKFVTRGKKVGGPVTGAEFELLKGGLVAWLEGRPLALVEEALGVARDRVGHCKRARDLTLKLASRRLYLLAAALSDLVRTALDGIEAVQVNMAAIETLAAAVRKGLDSPEKVAFAHVHHEIRSRVLLHDEFQQRFGSGAAVAGPDYETILTRIQTRS